MPRRIEFNEEEVLQKAMLLFWEKGYYDTSIKDLIQALGISNASIYNSFGGKKELFRRALAHYCETNFQGLNRFLQSQSEVRAGLELLFAHIIKDDLNDLACKGCFIVNSITELIPNDSTIQLMLDQHKMRTVKLFYDFLLEGAQTGQISENKNLTTIANVLYTLMTGLRVLGKSKPPAGESMASVSAVLSLLN